MRRLVFVVMLALCGGLIIGPAGAVPGLTGQRARDAFAPAPPPTSSRTSNPLPTYKRPLSHDAPPAAGTADEKRDDRAPSATPKPSPSAGSSPSATPKPPPAAAAPESRPTASRPPAPPSTPRQGTGSSGQSSMPRGDVYADGHMWRQVVAQDFDAPAPLGSVGRVYGQALRGYSGFADTSGHGRYEPDAVLSVKNGVLDYHLHSRDGQPLVAAPVVNDYRGQTYGRYSIRFRADDMPGYKMAFLLWPSSDQWNEGEIDWPEGELKRGSRMSPASAMKGTLSALGMKFDPPQRVYAPTDSTGWHVATTEWAPGSVKWFWDGHLVGQTTDPSRVPHTPFRWTLQAETNTSGPAPAPGVSGHLQVDWLVQYAY